MKTNTDQETKDIIKEVRKKARNKYPVVMKNKKIGKLMIIYKNKVEWYNLDKTETKKELDQEYKEGWNPSFEIETAISGGMKRVKDTTEKEDLRFN